MRAAIFETHHGVIRAGFPNGLSDRGSEGQVKMVALACSHLDVFDPITQPL